MSDPRQTAYTGSLSNAQVDVGLRNYMKRVYTYMTAGVALTGAIAFFVATNPTLLNLFAGSWLIFVFMAVWIGMGFFSQRLFFSDNKALGQIAFWSYAGVGGIISAGIIARFLGMGPEGAMMIAQAFLITSVMFLSMSILGYTTQRDLSGFGQFFFMATIGLVVAGLANAFFFQNELMALVVSALVVLVFAALTAYETQQIKHMYREGMGAQREEQAAVFGAFLLYGTFIVMFLNILQILGIMSSD